ncbi:hypothetical protein [Salinimicrobium gaetbulicola]|uniref:Uncharacterized protein n=1 Tax=Salinimicrobium gaetbulicola TaxID=999702 RepID=A0ABW3IJ73_9FLAO
MKLDTIQLKTHTGYLQDFDRSRFNHARIKKVNDLVVDNYSLAVKSFGMESLNVNETFDFVALQVNSKILKDQYSEGITINTLERLLAEVSALGVKLDPSFLEDCDLKRIDVADDISVTAPASSYFNSLNHLIAPKFYKTTYDSGIVFKEKIASQKLYTTFYSKESPSIQDKRFFKEYAKAALGFKNKIRMETKLSTAGTIKKYLSTSTLPEILQDTTLNAVAFDKIINGQLDFPGSITAENLTLTEEKHLIYAQYLFSFYKGDHKRIVEHVKRKVPSKTGTYYQLRQIERFLSILSNSKDSSIHANIEEVKSGIGNLPQQKLQQNASK